MYTLFHDKKGKVIEVKKSRKALQYLDFTEEVKVFNDCYYFCSKRKPLIEKAREIKREWVLELESELNSVKEIKI